MPVAKSWANGGAATALRPERNMVNVKAPAATPKGVPVPPDKDTPPSMAAAADGTSTSESPDGEAEASP